MLALILVSEARPMPSAPACISDGLCWPGRSSGRRRLRRGSARRQMRLAQGARASSRRDHDALRASSSCVLPSRSRGEAKSRAVTSETPGMPGRVGGAVGPGRADAAALGKRAGRSPLPIRGRVISQRRQHKRSIDRRMRLTHDNSSFVRLFLPGWHSATEGMKSSFASLRRYIPDQVPRVVRPYREILVERALPTFFRRSCNDGGQCPPYKRTILAFISRPPSERSSSSPPYPLRQTPHPA
jgi:hypothetical protein